MAANQVAYLPNPQGAYSKTIGYSGQSVAAQSLFTHPGGSVYLKVKSFVVTLYGKAAVANESVQVLLKIGSSYFSFVHKFTSTTLIESETFTSSSLGISDITLESAGTITSDGNDLGGGSSLSGGNVSYTVALVLEDYTA